MIKNCNTFQHGTALLNALLLILFISSTIGLWLKQTKNEIFQLYRETEQQQIYQLEEAANIWASQTLKQKFFHESNPELTCMDEQLINLPPKWHMTVKLFDAQSVFNINSLSERSMQISFVLLMEHILKDTPKNQLKDIFMATLAWVDPSLNPTKMNSINAHYQKSHPGYQAGGQPMSSLSEWKKVYQVTPKVFKAMTPFLTALPEATPININTCNEEILRALKPNLKKEAVKKIMFARGDTGFKNSGELFAILEEFKIPVQNTTIHSQYFWVDIVISSPTHHKIHLKNLFYRRLTPKGAQSYIALIKRFQLS